MVMAVLNYGLQIANLVIFFRCILGYSFEKNKTMIWIGTALLGLNLLIRILFWENLNPTISLIVLNGTMVLLPMITFDGNKKHLLLIGINYRFLITAIYAMLQVINQDHIMAFPYLSNGCTMQFIILIVLSLVASLLFVAKIGLRDRIETISTEVLTASAGILLLLKWTGGVVSSDESAGKEILTEKINLFIIVITIMMFLGFVIIHILIAQKSDLANDNKLSRECLIEQQAHLERLKEKDHELRAFKHDYKAHLLMINTYLEKGNLTAAKGYVNQIAEISRHLTICATGNNVIDAILNQYKEQGIDYSVKIDVLGRIPSEIKIREIDLCTFFSNAMSNAYEATLKCDFERIIEIQITEKGGFLFITIINPALQPISYAENGLVSTKMNKKDHGIGTKNMLKIAKMYDGEISWKYAEGKMTTSARLRYN